MSLEQHDLAVRAFLGAHRPDVIEQHESNLEAVELARTAATALNAVAMEIAGFATVDAVNEWATAA